jgi:outer membrane protein OmpA-like peptidoglycan-associated protein
LLVGFLSVAAAAAFELKESRCERRLLFPADALFEFGKAKLTPAAEQQLGEAGPRIATTGKHRVVIEGHTDSVGKPQYNQRLSLRRAQSVRRWLASHDFVDAHAAVRGLGEKHPIAPNRKPDGSDDPEGRAKNRRVEIVIDLCH